MMQEFCAFMPYDRSQALFFLLSSDGQMPRPIIGLPRLRTTPSDCTARCERAEKLLDLSPLLSGNRCKPREPVAILS